MGTRKVRVGERRQQLRQQERARQRQLEGDTRVLQRGEATAIGVAQEEQEVQMVEGAGERAGVKGRRMNRALTRMMAKTLVQRRHEESLVTLRESLGGQRRRGGRRAWWQVGSRQGSGVTLAVNWCQRWLLCR